MQYNNFFFSHRRTDSSKHQPVRGIFCCVPPQECHTSSSRTGRQRVEWPPCVGARSTISASMSAHKAAIPFGSDHGCHSKNGGARMFKLLLVPLNNYWFTIGVVQREGSIVLLLPRKICFSAVLAGSLLQGMYCVARSCPVNQQDGLFLFDDKTD